jgi:cytochrome bd-type quinol oxidase subunit 2
MRLPGEPPPKVPRHPFRDSAILYGILAVVIVVVSALTGGGLARGIVIAIAFFVAATGWSWWRFRERMSEERGER